MTAFPIRLPVFVAASGLALLATPLLPVAAAGSFTWTQVSTTTAPSARYGHGMVYDSARGVTVLFGGVNPSGNQNDTWEWNGQSWTQRVPAVSPPARREAAIAYDAARHQTVVFGGTSTTGTLLGDTWTWDGTNWTQLSPATSPSPRWDSAMVYDVAIGKVVLFGGFDEVLGNFQLENDTWVWDGTTWAQLQPVTSPPARENHAMAYDTARGRIVLFGGSTQLNGAGIVQDTWEFDTSTWIPESPAVSPAARIAHTMTFDASRNVTLLFGGGAGADFGDTWAWDGSSWTQLTPPTSPACRDRSAMAFGQGGHTVLFGGYANCNASPLGYVADTWQGATASPIVVSGGNVSPIAEGYTYSQIVAGTFSGGVAPYAASINWGDGSTSAGSISPNPSGGYYVSATKAFLEEGLYVTQITVTDATGTSATAQGSFNVSDAYLAPSGINFTARKKITFSGPVASFTDADPNGTLTDYAATVNWGDGTTTVGTISAQASGPFQVQGAHQYVRQGTYSVTTQVRDSGGFSATATSTATVMAGD
jgi:Galactose oxidase, central domain